MYINVTRYKNAFLQYKTSCTKSQVTKTMFSPEVNTL